MDPKDEELRTVENVADVLFDDRFVTRRGGVSPEAMGSFVIGTSPVMLYNNIKRSLVSVRCERGSGEAKASLSESIPSVLMDTIVAQFEPLSDDWGRSSASPSGQPEQD
ncbi:MAG: hypothetical protein EOP32_09295 [Rhodococcus sp. (in: high G+C Gram-positive bacteria)]|nr:MAG: hypothetical protein EOP32_09295 [Rhodococcus sp. (in: high G+C Gram-positive bacteria)]